MWPRGFIRTLRRSRRSFGLLLHVFFASEVARRTLLLILACSGDRELLLLATLFCHLKHFSLPEARALFERESFFTFET